jgi:hypothetical protein
MPDLSADRSAILEQLQQADDAAERLLRGKTRAQANWQPQQGTSREHPAKDHARMVFEMVHPEYGAARAHAIQGAGKDDSNRSWRSSGLTRFLGISCPRAARPGVLGSRQLQSGSLQEPVRATASF